LRDEDRKILAELLDAAKKHKPAFLQADDVKVAQLWCALIELKKEIYKLNELLGRLEEPFKAIVEVGNVEKRKAIERIIREMVKPTRPEEEEATRKLVDSLMKF